MKIFISVFLILFIYNASFSQNVNQVNNTLLVLNTKTKPKIIFSLKKDILKINIYKNTTHLREDKIYIDDLDANGVFYDNVSKQITLKCMNEYCVERKIFINGDKKIVKNSSFHFSDNDSLNLEIITLLKKLIIDVNNNKIKVINNTVNKQVSDLGNNMLSINIIDFGYKILTFDYDRFFNNNKFSLAIPLSYGFSQEFIQTGIRLKYYFYNGEARYYKIGDINLKQSQVSYFVAPNLLLGYDKYGSFVKYLGEIGLYFQMANGLSFLLSGYLGEINYLKIKINPPELTDLDYNLKISVGYRF